MYMDFLGGRASEGFRDCAVLKSFSNLRLML